MDEERMIGNAVEVEKRRLAAMVAKKRFAVEELVKKRKLTKEELEPIRDTRRKFVLHVSPLEVIEKGDEDFIDDDVAENVNQIELVIHVIYHYYIDQYWSPPPPPSTATTANSSSSSSSSSLAACQHHDYHHPRDADDEDMILASCRPLCDAPQKFKIIIVGQGIFADDDDDDHTALLLLLGDLDVLRFEHNVVIRTSELEDLKRGIAHSISEAKATVTREKPKRARICCEVSRVAKRYFGSAEAATFAAVEDDAEEASASQTYFSYFFRSSVAT